MKRLAAALGVAMLAAAVLADTASDKRDAANRRLDPEKRIAACTRLIEDETLTPREHAWAHAQRADTLRRQERYEESLKDYDRSIELDPESPDAHEGRGISLYLLDRYEEAEAAFTRVIELNPRGDWAWYLRGRARVFLKRYEEAMADYDRSLELDPRSFVAYSARGRLHLRLEDHEKAMEDAEGMIALDPYYPDGYEVRGRANEALGRTGPALHDFAVAFALDPNLEGPDGGLRRLVPQAEVEAIPPGPVAFVAPEDGTDFGFLQTIKPQKKLTELDEAGLGDLLGWFKRQRVPRPTMKHFIDREVVSSDEGVTEMDPRDRLENDKDRIPDGLRISYYRALWPRVQPMGPEILLEIEHDRSAIDAFWPLEDGKTGEGSAVLRYVCPEEPTPMSQALGCEPGKRIEMGGIVWKGRVVGREKVAVPAGVFEAVVVEFEETITMKVFGQSRTDSSHLTYWYAPSAGWWVKRVRRYGTGDDASEATDEVDRIE